MAQDASLGDPHGSCSGTFVRALLAITLLVAVPAAAAAASDAQQRARAELDKQLESMVNIPKPVAHVQFFGLDESPYELTDVEFEIDGKPLNKPKLETLKEFGAITIHRGQVSHGDHVLVATVAYTDGSSMMFSATAGYTWRVTTRVTFTAQRGLETRILLTPSRDSSRERKEQFRLSSKVTPVMLAELDDGFIASKQKPAEAAQETAPAAIDAGEPSAAVVAEVALEVAPVAGVQSAPDATKLAVFRPAQSQGKKPTEEKLSAPPMLEAATIDAVEEHPALAPAVVAPAASQSAPVGPFAIILALAIPVGLLSLFFVARRRANRFRDR